MRRLSILLGLAAVLSLIGVAAPAGAQAISPTPVPVIISTPTSAPTDALQATSTPTRTPTPEGVVMLQAKESAGAVNVRAEPDPNADRLGSIRNGELYPVIGRYYHWLQFQYPSSPSGTGWVFDELVDVVGDANTIPDVNIFSQPTVDSAVINATQTWEAITQIPGGILTATANARILPAPGEITVAPVSTGSADSGSGPAVLPTFTYPPDVPTAPPTQVSGAESDGASTPVAVAPNGASRSTLPPGAPIAALGGLGLLGLLISYIRRR